MCIRDRGKTTLIPKPGEFRSDNQRPITFLNNMYRCYTSCLYVSSVVQGTTAVERLTIYLSMGWFVRMLREEKRNLSMAWIDVAKAYDSVDHGRLSEMFALHRFPMWFAKVMEKLANSWNTRIVAQTT